MFINPLFLRNDKEKIDGADGCRINKIKFRNRWVHPEGWYFEEDDYPRSGTRFCVWEGAKRIVRLSSGEGRGDEKPHSSIAPFFSATRRHDTAKKRNNQPRELTAGLCSFFVAAGGRWKLTTPLAESTALFFPPPPPPSLFCATY